MVTGPGWIRRTIRVFRLRPSIEDQVQSLEHWIHYYNHLRPHQGIDGASPTESMVPFKLPSGSQPFGV